MRLYPTLALVSSALALAACGGGGLSSGVSSRANVLAVCAINDNTCVPTPTSGGSTTPAPDSDADGTPDVDDTDGEVGSGAGGNVTGLVNGTRTLALQLSKLDTPTNAGDTALSTLSSFTTPSLASSEAAILSTNKPKTLKFEIDTKSAKNTQWAIPAEQTEFKVGTRDLTWVDLGHIKQDLLLRDASGTLIAYYKPNTASPYGYYNLASGAMLSAADLATPFYANQLARFTDKAGNPIIYRPSRASFIYTTTHTVDGVTYNRGTVVDTSEDFYWNQLKPYMGAKANGGAKADYREYRNINSDPTVNRDEVLQVWAWGSDSYSTHYINREGEDPKQAAWSYGGKVATNMPTSGSATYRGRFVGNAKTSNWTKPDGAEINPNALWRVQGRSELKATFGTDDITGTLSTESWTSYQESLKSEYTWFTAEAANTADPAENMPGEPSVGTDLRPDYYEIYDARITLNGKIKAPKTVAVPSTTPPPVPPALPIPPLRTDFDGTATLNNPYLSSNNPMYGGFFGTNGTEVTGIFNVAGTTVDPIGGSAGLNGDRGAYLDMNGSFNAKCTIVVATGLCAP